MAAPPKTMEPCSTPFGMFAKQYYDLGLTVMPCDGKEPSIRWLPLQKKRAGRKTMENWSERFPAANIGLVTGKASGITIVDCDELELGAQMIMDLGETPLQVSTPSGGCHLYYRSNGEKNQIRLKGQKIDIRGEGGFAVMPPSLGPMGNSPYRFYNIEPSQLTQDILKSLPIAMPGKLPLVNCSGVSTGGIQIGSRNKELFDFGREIALQYQNSEDFFQSLEQYNHAMMKPPLCNEEVQRTAKQIWKYKLNNSLVKPHSKHAVTLEETILELSINHTAFWLYSYVLANNNGLRKEFCMSPKGLAPVARTSPKTIQKAINTLTELGLIICVHKGGAYKGDASRYCFRG